jgi:hypothetical protein
MEIYGLKEKFFSANIIERYKASDGYIYNIFRAYKIRVESLILKIDYLILLIIFFMIDLYLIILLL